MKNLKNNSSSKKMIQALFIPAMIFAGVLIDPASSLAASDEPIDTSLVEDCQPPISDFTVRLGGSQAFLNWYVEGATKASIYLILRSADALNFTNIGDQKGAASPYDLKILHCFIDKSPIVGTSYYQLVTINADLSTSTSEVVHLNNNKWQTDVASTY